MTPNPNRLKSYHEFICVCLGEAVAIHQGAGWLVVRQHDDVVR